MSSKRMAASVDELITRGEDMKKAFKMASGSGLSLADREILDQWKLSCLSTIDVIVGKKNIFSNKGPIRTDQLLLDQLSDFGESWACWVWS